MNMNSSFERYIGVDYSGAETSTSSLKGLRVYVADRLATPQEVLPPPGPRRYWSRRGIAESLVERLAEGPPMTPSHRRAIPSNQAACDEPNHQQQDQSLVLGDIENPAGEDYLGEMGKDGAAVRWCENASNLTRTKWKYVKVPQKDYEALRPSRLDELAALQPVFIF
jgi:hypothetical protein